ANAVCTNTAGSRLCACSAVYVGDGFNCVDVNECSSNNGGCSVNAVCTNTPGSLSCACVPGYFGDGTSCQQCADVNHCATSETCSSAVNSSCSVCESGYWRSNGLPTVCTACTEISHCLSALTCTSASSSVCSV